MLFYAVRVSGLGAQIYSILDDCSSAAGYDVLTLII